MMKDKKEKSREHKPEKPISEDFKIALQAMTLVEDFETLKEQFFQGN